MEEFAEAVGLSRPTVSKYFQNPSSVRVKVREKIEAGLSETGFPFLSYEHPLSLFLAVTVAETWRATALVMVIPRSFSSSMWSIVAPSPPPRTSSILWIRPL
jgi:DNA-binding LacI/PurR family transcriptional regulator